MAQYGVNTSLPGGVVEISTAWLTLAPNMRGVASRATISEDVQETCMQRLTATMRFTEGVPPELIAQAITQLCADHPERYLLAFVHGYLGERSLLGGCLERLQRRPPCKSRGQR